MLATEVFSIVGAALRLYSAQASAANDNYVISNECERSPRLMEISPFGRNDSDLKAFAAKAAPVFTAIQINTTKRAFASAALWQKFNRTNLQAW